MKTGFYLADTLHGVCWFSGDRLEEDIETLEPDDFKDSLSSLKDGEVIYGFFGSDDRKVLLEIKEKYGLNMNTGVPYDREDLWMDEFEISYSLSKQLSCMEYIHTNYGDIPLDDEMKDILEVLLRKLLNKRLAELKQNN
jgi:hypothetical protein